jgi:hypothetical protein
MLSENSSRPKILLVALELHWPATARLPRALQDAGFEVGVACRPTAYLAHTRFKDRIFELPTSNAGARLFAAFARMVESWTPQLVMPMDDRTALFLAQAHAHANLRKHHRTLAALLSFSLGNPAAIINDATSKRATNLAAQSLGLRVPASRAITTLDDVLAFTAEHGFPVVLKQAFSFGGNGVFFCRDAEEAKNTLANMQRALRPLARFRAWRGGIRGRHLSRQWLPADRSIVATQFVAGRNATSLAAAFAGETLATLTAEAVECYPDAKGPTSVVRFIVQPEMRRTSETLIRHFGLTGLVGFDFIIDHNDAAWLLECNPRPTPIAHLSAQVGSDLCLALRQRLASGPQPALPAHPAGLTVAYFPQETWRNPASRHFASAFHDIPTDDPMLLDVLRKAEPWRHVPSAKTSFRLPRWQDKLLRPKLVTAIRRRIAPPKISLEIINGLEARSTLPLSMLCGMKGPEQSYLHDLAFRDEPQAEGVAILPLKTILGEPPVATMHGCSLIVLSSAEFKLSSVRRSGTWFMIPVWVRGTIALPLAPQILRGNSLTDDLRRLKKNQFEYEVTRDPARLDDFYHQLYVPYIRKAHGNAAHIQSYDEACRHSFDWELLLVRKKNGGQDLAGITILYEPARPRLVTIGIRSDGEDYVQQGVAGALYHFSFRHLAARGFAEVSTGGSRAFLRDGVLNYKKKMGQALTSTSWNSIALKVTALTPATKSFLQSNPFIHEAGGKLFAAFFTDSPLTPESLRKFDKEFYHPGLERLVVYSFRPDETLHADALPPDLAQRWEIRSAHELLESGFAHA